jgi:DNA-binding CsgD family transcriptional regulator
LSVPETGSGVELSEREREILRLVATGASNKDIARQLTISPNTVKVHLRNIFAKIGSASRTEATLYAIRAGLAAVPGSAMAATTAEPANALQEPAPLSRAVSNPLGVEAPLSGLLETKNAATPLPAGRSGWRAWRYAAGLAVIAIILGLVELWSTQQPAGPRATTAPGATHAPLPTPVRWAAKAPLPTARTGLAAAVYENMVYAIAGETDQGVTGIVERYDPNIDQWATLTAKPVAVTNVGAAVIGGLIYVPGGRLSNNQVTDKFEAYDPRRDKWIERAPMPVALSGYALAAFEGKLYIFGGWDGAKDLARTFEYSPDADLWVEKALMPTARGFAGAAVAGNRIYVIGGQDGQTLLGVNEAYAPEQDGPNSNPWQTLPPLPARRSHMGVASIAGIIHVLGGQPGDKPLTYDEQSGAWLPMPTPQTVLAQDAGVTALGTTIEVLGGGMAALPSGQHLRYQAIFVMTLPAVGP